MLTRLRIVEACETWRAPVDIPADSTMRRALTIAGSDSGGGAGIQADLKTFAAYGVYGASAMTAITAQNTVAVSACTCVPPTLVRAQIDAVLGDIGADAVKTGMLGSVEVVARGRRRPRAHRPPSRRRRSGDDRQERRHAARRPTPCQRSASGCCRSRDLLTPNIPEAAVLTGHDGALGRRQPARRRCACTPSVRRRSLVKGGHLPGAEVVDVLYDRHHVHELRGPRIPGRHTHGTGCTLASAIAADLARGASLRGRCSRAHTSPARWRPAPLGPGHGRSTTSGARGRRRPALSAAGIADARTLSPYTDLPMTRVR